MRRGWGAAATLKKKKKSRAVRIEGGGVQKFDGVREPYLTVGACWVIRPWQSDSRAKILVLFLGCINY